MDNNTQEKPRRNKQVVVVGDLREKLNQKKAEKEVLKINVNIVK